jgi:hypothetical protein
VDPDRKNQTFGGIAPGDDFFNPVCKHYDWINSTIHNIS